MILLGTLRLGGMKCGVGLIEITKESTEELKEAEFAEDDPILHPPALPPKSKRMKRGSDKNEASECESSVEISEDEPAQFQA